MSDKSREEVETFWGNKTDLRCLHKVRLKSGSVRIASGKEKKYKLLLVQI